jgi:hypothetical protein
MLPMVMPVRWPGADRHDTAPPSPPRNARRAETRARRRARGPATAPLAGPRAPPDPQQARPRLHVARLLGVRRPTVGRGRAAYPPGGHAAAAQGHLSQLADGVGAPGSGNRDDRPEGPWQRSPGASAGGARDEGGRGLPPYRPERHPRERLGPAVNAPPAWVLPPRIDA